jgi:competence protein ComEC
VSPIARALTYGWPTALVASTCIGLAAANWVRAGALACVLLAAGLGVAAMLLRSVRRLACMSVALLVVGVAWGGMRLDALDRSILASSVGDHVPVRVVVTGAPRTSPFAVRMRGEVTRFDRRPLRESVLLTLPPGRAPPQGAIIELVARPVAPRGPETGFDERGWLARGGVHVVLRGSEGWRVVGRRGGIGGVGDRLRRGVAAALGSGTSGEREALLTGIVLGADEGLSDELQDAFRASGLYHLLAVSGQNVGFTALGVLLLAYVLGLPRVVGHVLALAGIAAYVLAVGWQPSVVRAGVAASVGSLAWLAARPSDRWHALALGALVLLVWTPTSLLEPGFQLSFAAVAAIFLVAPLLRELHAGYPLPWALVELVGIAAACGAVTAPVLLFQFGSVPVWTVLANAVAEPAMPPLLGFGLLAALVAPVAPAAAVTLSWLAGWCAWWIAACARVVASLPYAQTDSPLVLVGLAGVMGTCFVVARLPPYRRRAAIAASLACIPLAFVGSWSLAAQPSYAPPAGLRVTFLDVGQGDSTLLETARGAVLVDQGPPEADVAGQLLGMGLRTLSALVLTHPQRDHIGGAVEVLRTLAVGAVLDPGLPGDNEDERAALDAASARGVAVRILRTGDELHLGRLVLRVLWPDGPGTPGTDPNDRAIVLLASFGSVDVLLTADAESNVTGRLPLRRVEVLKVAHHGSEDEGLPRELLVLRPSVAVVSAGAGNSFGHPRPETIAALERVPGLQLLRTDLNGRVVLESDGDRVLVRADRGVP